jgi:DNA-binding IclR family transcriptional regulator
MSALATVDKALHVLFHLHDAPGACGVTELGRALGLPKSSVHRLLSALATRDLVERDARGRYRPGVGLVALGVGVLEGDPVVAAARPVLEIEAEDGGETLFLASARAGRIRILDKAEGTGFLRAAPRIGSSVPLHATAVGKLYLAFGPEQVTLDDGSPERFTPRTRRGKELQREVETTRRRGWAENREEWMPGLTAIAAPIRIGERLVGTLAVAAPAARIRASDVPKWAPRIVRAAERIESGLEGRKR